MSTLAPKSLFALDRLVSRTWIPALPRSLRDWHAEIESDLLPAQRARSEGRENRPAINDPALDVTQQEIINRFSHGADSLRQALANQIDGATQLIMERRPERLDPGFYAEEAQLAAGKLQDSHRECLIVARMAERDTWRDLAKFKRDNALSRSARYPDAPVFAVFLVVFALLAETALNATLFAKASEQGLVGGFVLASLFSVINVAAGFYLLGCLALRHIAHANPWKRAVAVLVVFAMAAFAVFWNLLVAHYRDLVATFPESGDEPLTALPSALKHLWANPFDLGSVEGIALLCFGILVFIVAAGDGWRHFDDPYAGYGAQDRRYKTTKKNYEAAKGVFRTALAKTMREIEHQLAQRLAAQGKAANEVRDISAQAAQREREAKDSAAALARACTTHLRRYREENCAVRTTPAPTYFGDYPNFSVELPGPQATADAVEATLGIIAGNQAAAQQARRALRDTENEQLRVFLAYVDDIENEAERRLAERETADNHNTGESR